MGASITLILHVDTSMLKRGKNADLLKVALWARVGLCYTHSLVGHVLPGGGCDLVPQVPPISLAISSPSPLSRNKQRNIEPKDHPIFSEACLQKQRSLKKHRESRIRKKDAKRRGGGKRARLGDLHLQPAETGAGKTGLRR